MIPMYGFLQGDTLGLLVLARPEDTAADLCAKLQSAASVRVGSAVSARVDAAARRLARAVSRRSRMSSAPSSRSASYWLWAWQRWRISAAVG